MAKIFFSDIQSITLNYHIHSHRCEQIAIHEQNDLIIIRRKSYICDFPHPFEFNFPFTAQGPLSWGMIVIFMRKCFCYLPLLFPYDDYNGFNKSPPYWIISNVNIVMVSYDLPLIFSHDEKNDKLHVVKSVIVEIRWSQFHLRKETRPRKQCKTLFDILIFEENENGEGKGKDIWRNSLKRYYEKENILFRRENEQGNKRKEN